MVTEREVVAAVLEREGPRRAEKFIQEVCWRTYWKGWLEAHPEVWSNFLSERDVARDALSADAAKTLAEAEAGTTGIEGFDDWARELVETGWMHNHARMWFSSIWIFTLRLPWQLGADFFLRHLVDADPASNTLSWRWTAGLQTRGKTYLATAHNIARYKDLSPDWIAERFAAAIVAGGVDVGQHGLRGEAAVNFARGALDDAAARLRDNGLEVTRTNEIASEAIVAAATEAKVGIVVTPHAPVGPTSSALDEIEKELAAAGLALVRPRRSWDSAFWPHATRGFSQLREAIPHALTAEGLS